MPSTILIIGAGPAGLTAGYELTQRGICPTILEQSNSMGGLARTENMDGYRFDIGGHRFYTKSSKVQALWEEVMQSNDFLHVKRLSRIFYNGNFFAYPLELLEIITKLGIPESFRIFISWLKSQFRPYPQEHTFEEWVSNRFGGHLYHIFFKTYTEKVWGIPCNQIQAEWAAQRIKGLSFTTALLDSIFKSSRAKTLTKEFRYPLYGPGMMWDQFRQKIEMVGGQIWCGAEVLGLEMENGRVCAARVQKDGQIITLKTEQVISSMALKDMILRLNPAPPAEVLQAAEGLRYRDFLQVGLVLNTTEVFLDQWLYIHSPKVQVGRIQNFKNWSAAMLPETSQTNLGMEYFCNQGDELWNMSDDALIALAGKELRMLDLASNAKVIRGFVIRQPRAYPVYDATYQQHLAVIRSYLEGIPNLQTIGRNGMHRYNNQDHSMLTGLFAAANVCGEQHDLWEINMERSYYEEMMIEKEEEE
jgi:protoporphyrinogen oxidase